MIMDERMVYSIRSKDYVNRKSAKQFHNHISFKSIENASHEVNVDNPKAIVNIIDDFWHVEGRKNFDMEENFNRLHKQKRIA